MLDISSTLRQLGTIKVPESGQSSILRVALATPAAVRSFLDSAQVYLDRSVWLQEHPPSNADPTPPVERMDWILNPLHSWVYHNNSLIRDSIDVVVNGSEIVASLPPAVASLIAAISSTPLGDRDGRSYFPRLSLLGANGWVTLQTGSLNTNESIHAATSGGNNSTAGTSVALTFADGTVISTANENLVEKGTVRLIAGYSPSTTTPGIGRTIDNFYTNLAYGRLLTRVARAYDGLTESVWAGNVSPDSNTVTGVPTFVAPHIAAIFLIIKTIRSTGVSAGVTDSEYVDLESATSALFS